MKIKLLLFTSLIIGSIGLSFLLSRDVDAATTSLHHPSPVTIFAVDVPGSPAEGEPESDEPTSSCLVDGIGWIVCPVAKEMAKIVDAAYAFVSSLLVVQPLVSTGEDENVNVYNAWTIMRNFANVAFVIAFMIIIFSQLTSFGLNNYGIKKMLPRLVVAAILVNVSFWICAAAVDISNILGSSLNGLFEGLGAGLPNTGDEANINEGKIADQTGWQGITLAVLAGVAGATVLYVGLSALLPALIAALLAIVTVFMVLTLRQALIILLVIVSPLAFVAYLLPNTETLFKKWLALFKTMLLMYPIIAMIFGASALASTIVINTASGEYRIAIQIMGALIAIIPLALTPIVMKTAGGLLNRFGGFVNNPNKGPFDKMRKGAEGVRKRQEGRRAIRELNGERTMGFGKYKRTAKRERIEAGIESEKKRASNQYIASQVMDNSNFANKAAGGLNLGGPNASPDALERALSGAKFVVQQAELEEVKAESAKVEHMDAEALMRVIGNVGDDGTPANNSQAKIAAAIERLVNVGDTVHIEEVANKYGTADQKGNISIVNRVLAESLSKNGPEFLKASDIDNIKRGTMATTQDKLDANGNKILDADGKAEQEALANPFVHTTQKNIEKGVMSQEKMVTASTDTLDYANKVATPAGKQRLTDTANELMASEVLRGKIKHNAGSIEKIAKQQPTTVRNNQTTNVTVNNNANPNLGRTSPPPNTSNYTQQGGLYIPHAPQQPSTGQQPPQNPPRPPSNP